MSDPSVVIATTASLVVAIGGLTGWIRWAHPKWRARRERERQKDFALLGGPIKDPLTGKQVGTQPPLGQWMADINGGLSKLTETVSSLNDAHRRLNTVETRQAQLIRDVDDLKKARDERIAAHLDSAHAWRALTDGDPDLLPRQLPDDD